MKARRDAARGMAEIVWMVDGMAESFGVVNCKLGSAEFSALHLNTRVNANWIQVSERYFQSGPSESLHVFTSFLSPQVVHGTL
jgi:hypothetical protein